jgi:hypothetical protein
LAFPQTYHESSPSLPAAALPIRHVFAFEFPEQNGDNCLLTINFGFVDLPFSRLLA